MPRAQSRTIDDGTRFFSGSPSEAGISDKIRLIDPTHKLSISKQCKLLKVHSSRYYYKPEGETEETLQLMRVIEDLFWLDNSAGVRRMVSLRPRRHSV